MDNEQLKQEIREAFPKVTLDDYKSTNGDRDALVKVTAQREGLSEEAVQEKFKGIWAKYN